MRTELESVRQSAVRDMDPVSEIEFPSPTRGDNSETDSSNGDALAALQLLWKQRLWLFRVVARAFVVSVVIALLIPNQYESSVSIMPPDSMNNSGAMLAALAAKASPELAGMAGSLLGTKGSGALFVELFRSRSVQDRVIERLNLKKVYRTRYQEDARRMLNERTSVGEDRRSGVLSLAVTDRDPQRARDIAQTYVEELNRLVSEVSTSSARRERVFIEQRLAAVKIDLEDAEKQFSVFASKNSALDIKEQTKAMVESAALLQGQMIAAQSELEGLQQIYTPNNVRVRSARARIEELQKQLQKMGGTDASLESDATAGSATEGGATAGSATKSEDLYPSIRKLPLLGVQWADLYRRMKIQETVYELLNQQYELSRIQEAKEIPSVNAIDPANVPERKSWPPRTLLVAGMSLLSLAAASLWIIGGAHWRRIDSKDPGKQLMTEMFVVVSGHARAVLQAIVHRAAGAWHRLGSRSRPA